MTIHRVVIAACLVAIGPASMLYAQDEGDKPQPSVRTPDGNRQAIPREERPRAVERPAPVAPPPSAAPGAVATPRVERVAAAPAAAQPAAAAAADGQRRRDGGRDRGDNPAVGRAVPRGGARSAPAPAPQARGQVEQPRNRGAARVYVAPRYVAPRYNYYYYPRRYYPYGYGAFGLGYFYYDPYTWYPPSYYSGSGYYGGGYAGGYVDEGEIRLDVSPRFADVYFDGYYAGRVDEFDGTFQSLRLESGPHHMQIVAQGFAPLDFDVRIEPGRKITYRGGLQPFRP